MFVRADWCLFLGALAAGFLITYIWTGESPEFLDLRPVMTAGVMAQFALYCLGVWTARRLRARRAKLRRADLVDRNLSV